MENIIRIVECSDWNTIYGYLKIKDVSAEDVQSKIYEIKNDERFLEEHPDWTVEDVLNEFPDEWKWEYTYDNHVVEI